MMAALMSACSLINAGAGTEEVRELRSAVGKNKYLGITKLQPIGFALDFCPLLSEASQGGNLLPQGLYLIKSKSV